MLHLLSKSIAVFAIFFIFNCSSNNNRNYGRSNIYRSAPYAVPTPVRQPVPIYNNQYQSQPYYRGVPNSRSYYNPYDFQQPYGQNPYSDYDQYYVPPVQYYNNEEYEDAGAGFSGKS